MKKLLFILPFILLLSCSVQKRKYQKGFYVSNLKHKKRDQNNAGKDPIKKTNNEALVAKQVPLKTNTVENEIVSASADNNIILLNTSNSKFTQNNPDSLCDRIILKNGDESMVKILEITPSDVKYKKCDSPDGPLYVVKKADVFMVQYANGTKEVFKAENTVTENNSNTQTNRNNEGPRRIHPLAIVAIVCAFLGFATYGLLSILGLIFAIKAERKIRQNPKVYSGATLAKVARIICTVFLSIIISAIILVIIAS